MIQKVRPVVDASFVFFVPKQALSFTGLAYYESPPLPGWRLWSRSYCKALGRLYQLSHSEFPFRKYASTMRASLHLQYSLRPPNHSDNYQVRRLRRCDAGEIDVPSGSRSLARRVMGPGGAAMNSGKARQHKRL